MTKFAREQRRHAVMLYAGILVLVSLFAVGLKIYKGPAPTEMEPKTYNARSFIQG